jgi:hypothetical protein
MSKKLVSPMAVSLLAHAVVLGTAAGAAVLASSVGVPSSTILALCASILIALIISVSALPEVITSLIYHDEMRAIASHALGFSYWLLLITLIGSLLLCIVGSVCTDTRLAVASGESAPILVRLWSSVRPAALPAFVGSVVLFGPFFAKLVRRVASHERVVGRFTRRVIWAGRLGRRRRFVEQLDALSVAARGAARGHERMCVCAALAALGQWCASRKSSPFWRDAIYSVLSGLEGAANAQETGQGQRDTMAIVDHVVSLLDTVHRNWGAGGVNYLAFLDSITGIAVTSIRAGQTDAALYGANTISGIAQVQLRLGGKAYVPLRTCASSLERIGQEYMEARDRNGALLVIQLLLHAGIERTLEGSSKRTMEPGVWAHAASLALRIVSEGDAKSKYGVALAPVSNALPDRGPGLAEAVLYLRDLGAPWDADAVMRAFGGASAL